MVDFAGRMKIRKWAKKAGLRVVEAKRTSIVTWEVTLERMGKRLKFEIERTFKPSFKSVLIELRDPCLTLEAYGGRFENYRSRQPMHEGPGKYFIKWQGWGDVHGPMLELLGEYEMHRFIYKTLPPIKP